MSSPVQPARNRPWLIFAGAAIAAVIAWSVQQDFASVAEPVAEERGSTQASAASRASANLPALFSSDDYPQGALRHDEQGTVGFTLSVNKRGRVENCEIAQSSGSAALDQATCSILTRRARFTPARSTDGEAVADVTKGRIRWQLPD